MTPEEKTNRFKVIAARVALVFIALFIILACVCIALGSKELMMASLFSIVIVPIIAWVMIFFYQKVHSHDNDQVEIPGPEENEASEEESSEE